MGCGPTVIFAECREAIRFISAATSCSDMVNSGSVSTTAGIRTFNAAVLARQRVNSSPDDAFQVSSAMRAGKPFFVAISSPFACLALRTLPISKSAEAISAREDGCLSARPA